MDTNTHNNVSDDDTDQVEVGKGASAKEQEAVGDRVPVDSDVAIELLKIAADLARYLGDENPRRLAENVEFFYRKLALTLKRQGPIPGPGRPSTPNKMVFPVNVLEPAVPIDKSVTPDYIICLEDGKAYKNLRAYLRRVYNMTPEQYRAKWGLPATYPMLAPNYIKARSMIAKKMGLGRSVGRNLSSGEEKDESYQEEEA